MIQTLRMHIMNDLEQILANWQKDCQIISDDLSEVSRATPALHSKYLNELSLAKLKLKDAEMKQKTLLKDKWLWYNGKMPQEKIEQLGWAYDPLDGLKIMKGDMDHYYDSDPEIQASELKIQYLKTTIDTLKEIVEALRWRHQTISNMIKWKQYEAGF